MTSRPATVLAAVATLIFAEAQVRSADIYVLSNATASGTTTTDFGTIDSVSGVYTSIVSLSFNLKNLAWNATGGYFFVTEGGASTNLRTLTTTGTLSAPLGSIGRSIYGMAFRTLDSVLYAYDNSSDVTGTINTGNGAWTSLNSNPNVSVATPSGGRYSIMNDTMYFTVNAATDGIGTMGYTNTSTYQQIAPNSVYANMVLANDGTTMYGIFGNGVAGQQRLYTIDVGTGAATAGAFVTGTGLGTYFHGAAIVPVPEPSTYALGAIASGVMAYLARRRKAHRA